MIIPMRWTSLIYFPTPGAEILWKRTTEGHRQREQGEYEVGDLSLRLEALKYQDYGI